MVEEDGVHWQGEPVGVQVNQREDGGADVHISSVGGSGPAFGRGERREERGDGKGTRGRL